MMCNLYCCFFSDNMDDWDEAKLEEVVNKKHGEKNKSLPKTSIVSTCIELLIVQCKISINDHPSPQHYIIRQISPFQGKMYLHRKFTVWGY